MGKTRKYRHGVIFLCGDMICWEIGLFLISKDRRMFHRSILKLFMYGEYLLLLFLLGVAVMIYT